MITKYITIEQDIIKLENNLKSILNLVNWEAFDKYGRHAYMYDRHYKSGLKCNRITVRRTIRKSVRLLKVINKKHASMDEDINRLRKLVFLSGSLVNIQMKFM